MVLFDEGIEAYESLTTPCEKTEFFLNYLRSIEQKENTYSTSLLYKIAFIMSSSMVDSSLPFGGYPNVLDANKNAFIGYIKYNTFKYYSNDNEMYCLKLLEILHNSLEYSFEMNDFSYGVLSFSDSNALTSDVYKIERDIITAFDLLFLLDKKLPYGYSRIFEQTTNEVSLYVDELNRLIN